MTMTKQISEKIYKSYRAVSGPLATGGGSGSASVIDSVASDEAEAFALPLVGGADDVDWKRASALALGNVR